MVNGTHRLLALGTLWRLDDVENRMRPALPCFKPRPQPLLGGLAKAHRVDQEVDRRRRFGDGDRHRVEAADRGTLVDRALFPRHPALIGGVTDQLELDAVRVDHHDAFASETARPPDAQTERAQAAVPVVKRTPLRPGRPAKEGHCRARRAEVVAEIDVVGVGEVLVDALFDEAQAQDTDIEVGAFLDVPSDGGHVVDAGHAGWHGLSLVRRRTNMT